ncbi:biliverdin-producing heme oxygenase [Erythrobacter sp. T5W1-R]|uniref:biliverdin-producing heme oxygenase n=1 Tax=Erythrobacter sp. T5W1-R TaxID=3101752 RepID=UPI002B003491|nr:biliverdin-producing heme oxygenase [Erythrobacter sp. T5W1-R]
MPSTAHQGPAEDLRLHLRAATMAAHDLLDHSMQAASGWQNRADYARFLTLQHAARAPIEAWLAEHAPVALQPPVQTPLIAQDLAALGLGLPSAAAPFRMADEGAGEALGAAWVLAGSALGNKAILKQMRRASAADGDDWPAAFLGDETMLAFWQALRARLEQPASAAQSAAAAETARAVFAHFIAHAQDAGGVAA